jgi:hypothetical protein
LRHRDGAIKNVGKLNVDIERLIARHVHVARFCCAIKINPRVSIRCIYRQRAHLRRTKYDKRESPCVD